MAESPREQALVAIVTALQAMSGTRHWGGIYPSPVRVERCYRIPETIAEWPWLGVFRQQGSVYHEVAFVGHFEDRFAIQIAGVCAGGQDATTPATWIERLHRDVRLTLAKSQTLGGLIRTVEWGEEPEDENAAQLAHLASFIQNLTVIIDDVIAVE